MNARGQGLRSTRGARNHSAWIVVVDSGSVDGSLALMSCLGHREATTADTLRSGRLE